MTFDTFKTFQASIEASARELAAKQIALVQSFAEKQKAAFTNPSALTQESFAQNQTFVQDFVTAQQAFFASSFLASQTFWREQLAENQAALQAAGIPGFTEVAARVQEAVEKVSAAGKSSRAKR